MKPAVRQTLLLVHRWTGLTLGLLIACTAITGTVMIFRPQVEPVVDRGLRTVTACAAPLPLDEVVSKAQAAHAGSRLNQVEIPEANTASTIVRFADLQAAFVDPCRGVVLGEQYRWGGVFGTIEQVHRFRYLGNTDVSELIAGTLALVLAVVMVAGGLAVWWPSSLKALKGALTLRPRLKGRAFMVNLHRTTGAYVAVILLAAAITSLPFVFSWARTAIFALTGSSAPAAKPAVAAAPSGKFAPAGDYLSRARALAPDARDILIQFPRMARDAVEVSFTQPGAPHRNARSFVFLDPATANVLRFDSYAGASLGYRVVRWFSAIHMGYVGGFIGQLLQLIGILGVPVLAYTGISGYLRRRLNKG